MNCQVKGCDNAVFNDQDKCALHCDKNDYETDLESGLLERFYYELEKHIKNIRYPKPKIEKSKQGIANLKGLEKYGLLEKKQAELMNISSLLNNPAFDVSNDLFPNKKIQKNKILILSGILFPEQVNEMSAQYLYQELLTQPHDYQAVYFEYCTFNTKYFELELSVAFFKCSFNKRWLHSNFKLLTEKQDSFYCDCIFNKSLVITSKINDKLFSNTIFIYSRLIVINAIISTRAIWNNLSVSFIYIIGSVFEDKLEIKNNNFKQLSIHDTNFSGLVDFYESSFDKFEIQKCIFNEFVAFEKCKFCLYGSIIKKIVLFKYVTFKDFINFRGAKFYSGLSLENINTIKEPNFLNATFTKNAQKTTDRETFRIIKHSFDAVGNHIEANQYFAYEMEAYRRELRASASNKKEQVLLGFNSFISSHGQNYLKAASLWFILVVCIGLILANDKNQWLPTHFENLPNWWLNILNALNSTALGFLPFTAIYQAKEHLAAFIFLSSLLLAGVTWHLLVAIRRHSKR